MAIRAIVELTAKPGRRDKPRSMIEEIVATQGPNTRGYLGGELYEVLGDPDGLVEIAGGSRPRRQTRSWRTPR